jgi:hypothetical protein
LETFRVCSQHLGFVANFFWSSSGEFLPKENTLIFSQASPHFQLAFFFWQIFTLWQYVKKVVRQLERVFLGKNGPKSPYLESGHLQCCHFISRNPKFSNFFFYLSPNLVKSSCGRSPTQLLHNFENKKPYFQLVLKVFPLFNNMLQISFHLS